MRIVNRAVADGQFGGQQLFMFLKARGEGAVEDAAGEEGPLDGVGDAAGVDHPLDGFEQIGEVGVARLGSFFKAGRQEPRLPLKLEGDGVPADAVGEHEDGPEQSVRVLKQEEGRVLVLSQFALLLGSDL